MDSLLEKISSYSLLNNLIPGAVFCYLCQKLCDIDFTSGTIIENILVYYFLGLVISCIGSLIIEELCKKINLIIFKKYENFLDAIKIDPKIETLSEINNSYRTMAALGLVLAVIKIYMIFSTELNLSHSITHWIIIISLFTLFIFEYQKQTEHITKRIKKAMVTIRKQRSNHQDGNP